MSRGRGREQRERIPSGLHAVSTKPDVGLKPTNYEIMTLLIFAQWSSVCLIYSHCVMYVGYHVKQLGYSVAWRASRVAGGLCKHEKGAGVLSLKKIFFFNVYLYLGQRETEHERGRGRERETQNRKQAPGSEPSAQSPTLGWNSRTARS